MKKERHHRELGKKGKKKKHRLYAAIVLFLAAAIVVLGIYVVFHIQKIEIRGNEYTSEIKIQELVQNDKFSTNSLYVVGKYMAGKGESLPCFDSIKVTLKAPWTIKVVVEEKPIVGFLFDEKEYIYFDKDGLVVQKGTMFISDLPCVEGIDMKGAKLYEKLNSGSSKIFEEILEASEELKKLDLVAEKIVCDSGKIYLQIGAVTVSMGNDVTSEKMAQIPPVIEKLDGKAGTLHLENYSAGQETVTFTAGEEAEEPAQEPAEESEEEKTEEKIEEKVE